MLDCQIVLIVGLKRPLSALGWCRQIGHDLSKLYEFVSFSSAPLYGGHELSSDGLPL